MPGLIFIF